MSAILRIFIKDGDLTDHGLYLISMGAVAAMLLKIGGVF